MRHKLSFGYVSVISENIAEVVVNQNIVMTLEMVDEYDYFLKCHFNGDFGLLINKINQYSYTYEAQLSIASLTGIKAMAIVNYNQDCEQVTNILINTRQRDDWNLKKFSGFEFGFQLGITWLEQELLNVNR